ncbi:MAG: hypothetical protein ABUU24_09640 [Variovorax sp.]
MNIRFKHHHLAAAVAALSTTGLMMACGGSDDAPAPTPTTPAPEVAGPGVYDTALAFDKTKYTTITVTLDGVSTPVRWYREVCYVGKPMQLAPTQSAGAVGPSRSCPTWMPARPAR